MASVKKKVPTGAGSKATMKANDRIKCMRGPYRLLLNNGGKIALARDLGSRPVLGCDDRTVGDHPFCIERVAADN